MSSFPGISQRDYDEQMRRRDEARAERDTDADKLREAARRLDTMCQFATPPIDRNMERVADWLRKGIDTPAEHRGNYLAAANALLGNA